MVPPGLPGAPATVPALPAAVPAVPTASGLGGGCGADFEHDTTPSAALSTHAMTPVPAFMPILSFRIDRLFDE